MDDKIEKAKQEFKRLRNDSKSLILSTTDAYGRPDASTVPYVYDDQGNFIVFISQLAQHTKNLKEQPKLAVMLIEDEATACNLFARKRVQYSCGASQANPEDQDKLLELFRVRHGKVVDLLSTLPDFVLFKLMADSGQFVMGFGQAYRLCGEQLDQFELISPKSPDRST
ncbi:MAG: pyridoxamine 5'-phosphate oxidase family protein [Gammaproteobacteria bacterium]|nr:pyridoxamine 5'-phosphate oxidase family protein [Gammaproteobacteria bacterium]